MGPKLTSFGPKSETCLAGGLNWPLICLDFAPKHPLISSLLHQGNPSLTTAPHPAGQKPELPRTLAPLHQWVVGSLGCTGALQKYSIDCWRFNILHKLVRCFHWEISAWLDILMVENPFDGYLGVRQCYQPRHHREGRKEWWGGGEAKLETRCLGWTRILRSTRSLRSPRWSQTRLSRPLSCFAEVFLQLLWKAASLFWRRATTHTGSNVTDKKLSWNKFEISVFSTVHTKIYGVQG